MQYDVQSVDSKTMVDGIWWYSVTWCDGDKTVEPRINLEGAEDMVAEFEKGWAEWEAANAKPVQGSRVARNAVPLEVAGAGAGEPIELQQAMVMMAQSVSAMVQCQAEVKAGMGSSAATDGKLPGMRDLMGGSKRLKEVASRSSACSLRKGIAANMSPHEYECMNLLMLT